MTLPNVSLNTLITLILLKITRTVKHYINEKIEKEMCYVVKVFLICEICSNIKKDELPFAA